MKNLLLWLLFFLSLHLNAQEQLLSTPGVYSGYNLDQYPGFKTTTVYLPMRDSVLLAADIHLPKQLEAGKKIPTLLYLTRYGRSLEAAGFIKWLNPFFFNTIPGKEIRFFTEKGYACIAVDVRGTGASTGVRSMEFSAEELVDGSEIVDWIIQQEWSNGKVGTTGISYLGTTAEFILVNQHPAVKAVVNRSGIFDLYSNICFPGGVRLGRFIEVWRNSTYALDNSELEFFSFFAGLLAKGPAPVKADKKQKILKRAIKEHEDNFDIFPPIERLTHRNEIVPELGRPIDDYSIHRRIKTLEDSGTPVYRISGWYDGGNCNGAIQGYLSTKNTSKLLIGAWDHGPHELVSPWSETNKVQFSVYTEILRFFDFHLKGIDNGIQNEAPINYYTIGQESWNEAKQWPASGIVNETIFFSADQKLSSDLNTIKEGNVSYQIDYNFDTGGGSRWNSLTPEFRYNKIGYPNWEKTSKDLLTFSGPVLEVDMELTGHPIIQLQLSADATDATIFVYLQDKAPDGKVHYITEGQFRAIHRKVSEDQPPYRAFGPYHSFKKEDAMPIVPNELFEVAFDLLPTSYLLKKGHQLQIAIAGADIGHFDPPEDKPSFLKVYSNKAQPSQIELPIRK